MGNYLFAQAEMAKDLIAIATEDTKEAQAETLKKLVGYLTIIT